MPTFTVLASKPFICPRCSGAWVFVKAERDSAFGVGGQAGRGTPQFSVDGVYRCCEGVAFMFQKESPIGKEAP